MARSPLSSRLFEVSMRSGAEVEDASGRRPWAQVLASSLAFANELSRTEGSLVRRRILLQGEPSAAWVRAFVAIVVSGGVVVPVAMGTPAPELAYFASDAEAGLAIVTHDGEAPFPESVKVVHASTFSDDVADPPLSASRAAGAPALGDPAPGDPALVLYTSGTTGKPKGAVLTHENLATQAAVLREAWAFRDTDVLLHTLPMHHLHGIVVALLTALTTPAEVVMLPRFDPKRIFELMGRATVFMAVPTMYQRLFEAFDAADAATREAFARDAKRLRLATSGSAALPTRLAERWRGITGTIPLERYGMTEIGMALSNTLSPEGRRAGKVGRPLPTVEARIVDEEGRECNGPGELWVRGPSVFSEYLGKGETTKASFREGWFMTGDVAQRDEEGVIRLLGRSSVDILKSGGEKISALEIEETLREHPAIAEVAVVGLSDEVWGERVVAVVVPRAGRELECDEAAIRSWAKERLAAFKVPREVRTVASLPRNAMGKVLKPEIAKNLTIPSTST